MVSQAEPGLDSREKRIGKGKKGGKIRGSFVDFGVREANAHLDQTRQVGRVVKLDGTVCGTWEDKEGRSRPALTGTGTRTRTGTAAGLDHGDWTGRNGSRKTARQKEEE